MNEKNEKKWCQLVLPNWLTKFQWWWNENRKSPYHIFIWTKDFFESLFAHEYNVSVFLRWKISTACEWKKETKQLANKIKGWSYASWAVRLQAACVAVFCDGSDAAFLLFGPSHERISQIDSRETFFVSGHKGSASQPTAPRFNVSAPWPMAPS